MFAIGTEHNVAFCQMAKLESLSALLCIRFAMKNSAENLADGLFAFVELSDKHHQRDCVRCN